MRTKPSYFIKTRFYHMGFPKKFQYYPEGMEDECLEQMHILALETMDDPAGIAAPDHLKRCVIADGRYLVLGIGGYLCDIVGDLAEEYHRFCDVSNTRIVQGFFAFVWDLSASTELPKAFPALEEYAGLFREKILPYWEEPAHSDWVLEFEQGIPVAYDRMIEVPDLEHTGTGQVAFASDKKRSMIHHVQNVDALLLEAIAYAGKGGCLSLCTGMEIRPYYETSFEHWIVLDSREYVDYILLKSKRSSGRTTKKSEQALANKSREGEENWKHISIRLQIYKNIMEKQEQKILTNLLRGLSGARELDAGLRHNKIGSGIHLWVELLVPYATDTKKLRKTIEQELESRQKEKKLLWVSSKNITCMDMDSSENDALEMGQIWDGLKNKVGSRMGNLIKSGSRQERRTGQEWAEDEEQPENEAQEFIDQLTELYGAKDGKQSKTVSGKRSVGDNPFAL